VSLVVPLRYTQLTDSYVLNLFMLGVLMSQIWHWAAWSREERRFIRYIVVSLSLAKTTQRLRLTLLVLGVDRISSYQCALHGLVYQLFVVHYGQFSHFIEKDCTFLHRIYVSADEGGVSWLILLDQGGIVACQIFNLDRAYSLNGNKKWILWVVVPFM